MEKSIIREIFYGKRTLQDVKPTEKYSGLLNKALAYEEELNKKLLPEALELYKKATVLNDEINTESADTYFTEGFKIGCF